MGDNLLEDDWIAGDDVEDGQDGTSSSPTAAAAAAAAAGAAATAAVARVVGDKRKVDAEEGSTKKKKRKRNLEKFKQKRRAQHNAERDAIDAALVSDPLSVMRSFHGQLGRDEDFAAMGLTAESFLVAGVATREEGVTAAAAAAGRGQSSSSVSSSSSWSSSSSSLPPSPLPSGSLPDLGKILAQALPDLFGDRAAAAAFLADSDGSPPVLVVTSSGQRACDVIRSLRASWHRSGQQRAGLGGALKLFAKHFKVEAQEEAIGMNGELVGFERRA